MNLNHGTIVCTLVLMLLPFQSTHAYLDPGTGSIIIQVLLGGIAGAMVIARLYWQKIKSFFGTNKKGQKPTKQTNADNDTEAGNARCTENRNGDI